MAPANDQLMLEALRIEPSASLTRTLVDDSASALRREVARLDANLATLWVRDAQSSARDACSAAQAAAVLCALTSESTLDLSALQAALRMPVQWLPPSPEARASAVIAAIALAEEYAAASQQGSVRCALLISHQLHDWRRVRDAWSALADDGDDCLLAKHQCFDAHAWARGPQSGERESCTVAHPASHPSPADAAVTLRDHLLRCERWLTSTEVAEQARAGALVESNPHQYASRLRREGRLLGARFRGQFLHPAFQFVRSTGEPHPAMALLLALLPPAAEDHGWTAAFWCFAATRKLDGARPADVFQDQPNAVIEAARKDFRGDDADW